MAEFIPSSNLTAPIRVSEFISYRPEMIGKTNTSIQTGRELSVAITLDGKDLCDPIKAHEYCQRAGIDDSHWWGIANSWTQRRGRMSGEGQLLMTAANYAAIVRPKSPNHELVVRFGGDGLKISRLSIVDASAAIGHLERDNQLLVDLLSDESILLLTVKDAREFAQQSVINRVYNLRQRNGVFDRSTVDESGNPIHVQHILKHIWDNDLQPIFGTSLHFFHNVNEPVHIPEDLIFTGWSAWDAFWYLLDTYGWNFALTLHGDGWVFRNDTVNEQLDDEIRALNDFLLHTYESVDNSPLPNRIRVFAFSHDYQWYKPEEQPARHPTKKFDRLTPADQIRRFPLYEKDYALSDLVSFNQERLSSDNILSVYCPVPVITDDQGTFVNEDALHNAMAAVASEKAHQIVYADASENHIFAGFWPFQVGPFYDQVSWLDNGQGIMTRTSIGAGSRPPLPSADSLVPIDFLDKHEPAVRWVIAEIQRTSTGQQRIKPDTFCDILVLSGHEQGQNVNWQARKQVRAVNATNAELDVHVKVFAVWNYQLGEGGEWCIVASVETSLKEDEVALIRLKGPLESGSGAQLGAALKSTNCLFDGEIVLIQKQPCKEEWSDDGERVVAFDYRGYLPKSVLSYDELYLGVYLGFAMDGKKLYGLVSPAPPLQRVLNKSGGKLEQFRPAQITTQVGEAKLFAHHLAIEVYRVIADYGPFVIMAFDCEPDELGWAFTHGICPAFINDRDQTHHWADVRADVGPNSLTTGHEGSARIIKRRIEGSASSSLALVQLGELEDVSVCGELLNTLPYGSVNGRVRTEGGWVQDQVHHTCIESCDLQVGTQIRITFSRVAKFWVVTGFPPAIKTSVDPDECVGDNPPADDSCIEHIQWMKGLGTDYDPDERLLKVGPNGADESFDVVTSISCSNGVITYMTRTLTFSCGVLSMVGDEEPADADCCLVLEGQEMNPELADCMCCGDCPDCNTCEEEYTVSVGSPFTGICDCVNGSVITITQDGPGLCEYTGTTVTDCNAASTPCIDGECEGDPEGTLRCDGDCEQQECVDCSESSLPVENSFCCPTDTFGLRVINASLFCEAGRWVLRLSGGTVGFCPAVTWSAEGSKSANGACPTGTYDCEFIIDAQCDELQCNNPPTFNSPVIVS